MKFRELVLHLGLESVEIVEAQRACNHDRVRAELVRGFEDSMSRTNGGLRSGD